MNIKNALQLYEYNWVNSDSPQAFAAFICGLETGIRELASRLCDSPQAYEDAKSEDQWQEYLIAMLEKSK